MFPNSPPVHRFGAEAGFGILDDAGRHGIEIDVGGDGVQGAASADEYTQGLTMIATSHRWLTRPEMGGGGMEKGGMTKNSAGQL